MFIDSFISTTDLATVGVLILLEGLLSCDNAVVLALLVKDLPLEQRGRALRYGILGAYVFRIAALFAATWIMSVWWLKALGGAYLVFIAVKFFRERKDADHDGLADHAAPKRVLGLSVFWSTVIAVELTDIVFSIDSIAAAVALSSKLWVLIAGGLLGILAMRFAAQGFIRILERFPRLESAAFVAVLAIGLKLVLALPVDLWTTPVAIAAQPTAAAWIEAAHHGVPAWFHIPGVLAIHSAAPAAPVGLPVAEQAAALAAWHHDFRPFIHFDGLFTSLAVLGIMAGGLVRRK